MAHVMTRRISRIRPAAAQDDTAKVKQEAFTKAEDELKIYAIRHAEIERLVVLQSSSVLRISDKLRIAGKTGVSTSGMAAEFKESFSNTKTEIDPKKLYSKMKDKDEFFSVVKVSLGELKQVMTEKEINQIATITEPVSQGIALVIKPIKPRK